MITYDFREDTTQLPKLLKQLSVPLQSQTLEIGDYLIGNLPVEHKTAGDYIGSLLTGHLSTQLSNLSYNFERSVLLVTGDVLSELMLRQMTRNHYFSSLAGDVWKISPDGKRGFVSVINLPTEFDAALFLKFLHDKSLGDGVRLPGDRPYKRQEVSIEDRFKFIYRSFPNVGEVNSNKLWDKYQSLEELTDASLVDLAQILGQKRAESLYYGILHRPRQVVIVPDDNLQNRNQLSTS